MYLQWQFFIFIPLLLTIIGPTTGESWDYHNQGADIWSDTYPLCDGRSQSPIIIKTACTNYRKSYYSKEQIEDFISSTLEYKVHVKIEKTGYSRCFAKMVRLCYIVSEKKTSRLCLLPLVKTVEC